MTALGAAVAFVSLCSSFSFGAVLDYEAQFGAIPDADDFATLWSNGRALNASLAALRQFDTLLVPNRTYYLMGGIVGVGLHAVHLRLEGTLVFGLRHESLLSPLVARYRAEWPRLGDGARAKVLPCVRLANSSGVVLTSSGVGTLEGAGAKWWGIPGVGYLVRTENRPRLLHLSSCKHVLVERLVLRNSPYWSFYCERCEELEVRQSSVEARRTSADRHTLVDLTAFNTDGFDLSHTRRAWIHDSSVWSQDDAFDVKGDSSDVLIERVEASGLGLTIGSIKDSTVRNVTFRDATLRHSVKGIYLKFKSAGLVTGVTYENILIDRPESYAIWIGPAQQSDTRDPCYAGPCSLCWPQLPTAQCRAPAGALYADITLRNVTVLNPKTSPGVLLANETSPMRDITFDDVVVHNPGTRPWGDAFYKCEHVLGGRALGRTTPVPPCFEDLTAQPSSL